MMEQENRISPPPPIDYIFTPKSCDATEGLTFSSRASIQSKQHDDDDDCDGPTLGLREDQMSKG